MGDLSREMPCFPSPVKDGTKFWTTSLTKKGSVETAVGQIDP